MFRAPKNFEKQQRMFLRMTPRELCLYCDKHPLYSLPAGVRNYRTKQALAVMEDCAQQMSQKDRANLVVYVQGTFNRGKIITSTSKLQSCYESLFQNPEFESAELKKAISEFCGFSIAPMDNYKRAWIAEFVDHATPPEVKATAFQKGMDAYRQKTCIFTH